MSFSRIPSGPSPLTTPGNSQPRADTPSSSTPRTATTPNRKKSNSDSAIKKKTNSDKTTNAAPNPTASSKTTKGGPTSPAKTPKKNTSDKRTRSAGSPHAAAAATPTPTPTTPPKKGSSAGMSVHSGNTSTTAHPTATATATSATATSAAAKKPKATKEEETKTPRKLGGGAPPLLTTTATTEQTAVNQFLQSKGGASPRDLNKKSTAAMPPSLTLANAAVRTVTGLKSPPTVDKKKGASAKAAASTNNTAAPGNPYNFNLNLTMSHPNNNNPNSNNVHSGTTGGGGAASAPLASSHPAIAPVVHIRIRPLLPYLGETNERRRVWALDPENLIVQSKPRPSGNAAGSPQRSAFLNSPQPSDISETFSDSASPKPGGGGSTPPPTPRQETGTTTTTTPAGRSSPRVRSRAAKEGTGTRPLFPGVRTSPPPPLPLEAEQDGDEQHFTFELVHNEEATQEEVFEESVLNFADEALLAQNICILCYGPTGSGKTYSMIGDQRQHHHHPVNAGASATRRRAPAGNSTMQSPDSGPLGSTLVSSSGLDDTTNSLNRLTGEESEDVFLEDSTASMNIEPEVANQPDKAMLTESMGILPRLVTALLEHRNKTTPLRDESASGGGACITLRSVTFYGLELYMDEMSDLMDRGKRNLNNVRDTGGLGALCDQLDQAREEVKGTPRSRRSGGGGGAGGGGGGIPINTMGDLHRAYRLACRNRVTSSHARNDTSSRSHAIFIMQLGFDLQTQMRADGGGRPSIKTLQSYVALADLAGSERVKETQVQGAALREAQYINKSLSALSSVVLALYRRQGHVPYRDSKLTRLLRPCLEGGRVLTVVHVSPCSAAESINSLKFADQVRHTMVQTHGFGTDKQELQNIFEDLVDPAQRQVEDAMQRTAQTYAQLCAEVRLACLTQWAASTAEADTRLPPATTTAEMVSITFNSVSSSSGTENETSATMPAANSVSTDAAALATPQARRSFILRSLVYQHAATLRERDQEEMQQGLRRIEREQAREREQEAQRLKQMERTLTDAIDEITRANIRLAEENISPLPCDAFTQELARLAREATDDLGEQIKERQALTSLIGTLRQRLQIQGEVEEALRADLEQRTRKKEGMQQLLGGGDGSIGAVDESQLVSTLPDLQGDEQMREIFHQMVLLSQEQARLRLEVCCAQSGSIIWEGLWAQAMRTELLLALRTERSLMEDILLDTSALEDLLRPAITASGAGSPRAGSLGVSSRRSSSARIVYSGAEGEAAIRQRIRDYIADESLANIVVSRDESFMEDALEYGGDDAPEANNIGTGAAAGAPSSDTFRRLISVNRRSLAVTRTLPNPLQVLVQASAAAHGTALPQDGAAAATATATTAGGDYSRNGSVLSGTKKMSVLSLSAPQLSPAPAPVLPLTFSLLGTYGDEETLQKVSLLKLLEEGILCEVCCIGSTMEPVMEQYLCNPKRTSASDAATANKLESATSSSAVHLDPNGDDGEEHSDVVHPPTGELPMCTKWGRLRLTQSAKHPHHFYLDFVYTQTGTPLPRNVVAAMSTDAKERDELVEFVDSLPSSMNVRRGMTRPANTPAALAPPAPPPPKERRLFCIPLYEPELQLNLHVLEAGVVPYTPVVTAAGTVTRRREEGGQIAVELLGVPLPTGTPLLTAAVAQQLKSATSKAEEGESKDVVLGKRLRSGGELLLPAACTLSSRGACTMLLRFPSPTFSNVTRLESIEAIVAALSGVLLPTFTASATPRSRPNPVPSALTAATAPTCMPYKHIPYMLLHPPKELQQLTATSSFNREEKVRSAPASASPMNSMLDSTRRTSAAADGDDTTTQSLKGATLEVLIYLPRLDEAELQSSGNAVAAAAAAALAATAAADPARLPSMVKVSEENSVQSAEESGHQWSATISTAESSFTSAAAAGAAAARHAPAPGGLPRVPSWRERLLNLQRRHRSKRRASLSLSSQVAAGAAEKAAASSAQQAPSPRRVGSVASYIRSAALCLHQLRAVTVHYANTSNGDRRYEKSSKIGQRLQQLELFRRALRALVKHQIYNAQDIAEQTSGFDMNERVGQQVLEIEQAAREAIGLVLAGGGAYPVSAAEPASHSSPSVRSDVTVYEARELCGVTVPWTVWQWAYRWPRVAQLYQTEAPLWEQVAAAAAQAPITSPASPLALAPASPFFSPASGPSLPVPTFSDSDDEELFVGGGRRWWKESEIATSHAAPKTVWLPELDFVPVPCFLEDVAPPLSPPSPAAATAGKRKV